MDILKRRNPVPATATNRQSVDAEIDRPLRSLHIRPGTPWLEPVQLSAATIGQLATAPSTAAAVLQILHRLTDDDYLVYLRDYYQSGLEKFGSFWNYADLITFLHAASNLIQPRNVLEIGVRRGRSLAVVAHNCPECSLYGFDMWMTNYAGMANPGPELVVSELRNIGFRGHLELITGDSHETVPAFLGERPELMFDLINVDGDHSFDGAKADLETVLPRLAIGGAIVLDDIVHPQHMYLETVWDQVIGNDPNFSSFKYRDLGYGVAIAVRKR